MEAGSKRPVRKCRIANQFRENNATSDTESEKASGNTSITSATSDLEVTINHLGNVIYTPAPEKTALTPARIILEHSSSLETPLSSTAVSVKIPQGDLIDEDIDNIDKGGELVNMLADFTQNASAAVFSPSDSPKAQTNISDVSLNHIPSERMWPFSPDAPACNQTNTPTLAGAQIMQSVQKILNQFIAKLEDERKQEQGASATTI